MLFHADIAGEPHVCIDADTVDEQGDMLIFRRRENGGSTIVREIRIDRLLPGSTVFSVGQDVPPVSEP